MRIGLTKERSMGPVAVAVEQAGGSVARVFRRAEMPLQLIEQPDQLMLLRDQLRIVEGAAREIGDAALPARLSLAAGVSSLGPYGVRVCTSDTLGEALTLGSALIVDHLQTATQMDLTVAGGQACIRYRITDASEIGRQKNEILALGYILDVLRRFLGAGFMPDEATVSGGTLQDRPAIETALGCALRLAAGAAIRFDARLLAASHPGGPGATALHACALVPDPDDFVLCAGHLIRLGLMEGRPPIDWLGRRLGLSRRGLQRRLEAQGTTFGACLAAVVRAEAEALLSGTTRPIGQIALDLGYADPAHFSRAFRGWTGLGPALWRRAARNGAG